jgi:quercetin dioxygenase-like cupin family protein
MKRFRTCLRTLSRFVIPVVWTAFAASHAAVAQTRKDVSPDTSTGRARVALSHTLPHLDGRHLKATIVEVTYGPGESSSPHSHPCPVIGYVIQGALRTQVKGKQEATYKAGQSFYEAPNGVHMVSANASSKAAVKFLAYFVCDHEAPLSVAVSETREAGGKKP